MSSLYLDVYGKCSVYFSTHVIFSFFATDDEEGHDANLGGFIVDHAEDEAEGDDDAGGSDSDGDSGGEGKRKHGHDSDELDEDIDDDEYALLEENLGIKLQRKVSGCRAGHLLDRD